MVTVLIAALGCAAIVGFLVWVPFEYCILLPFCSVMWLGPNFHLGGTMPVAPHVLLFGLVLAKWVVQLRSGTVFDPIVRNGSLLLFCSLFVGAVFYGLARSATPAIIKEDATSFLYLMGMYAVFASSQVNLSRVINGIVFAAAVSSFKVLYLCMVPVNAMWSNDWQATVLPGKSVVDSRIILNGADVYFVLAAAFPLAVVLVRPQVSKLIWAVPALTLIGVGLVLSSTRSNWLGFGAMVCTELVVLSRHGVAKRGGRSRIRGGLCAVVVLLAALAMLGEYSPLPRIVQRFGEGDSTGSVSLREAEANALLESVGSSVLLGLGMGGQYPDPINSGMPTGFSHNGYLFLYLKMGLVGVVVYAVALTKALARLWRGCALTQVEEALRIRAGLLGALVGLCVLSVTVNKNFDVSGALFTGLAFGVAEQVNSRRTPLSCRNHPRQVGARAYSVDLYPENCAT